MAFETTEQVIARRTAAEEARRKEARANFQKERPELGQYLKFVVTGEQVSPKPSFGDYETKVGEGCPSYILRFAPLDLNGTPQLQFEVSEFITLPVVNTEIEGHKVENKTRNDFIKMLKAYLRPDEFQKIDKGQPGAWKNDPETRAAIAAQDLAAEILAAKLVAGDEKIGEVQFFGEVGHKKNGSYYVKNKTVEPAREVEEPTTAATASTD